MTVTPGWLPILFPDAEPLVYALSRAGKQYATQWTRYAGERDTGLHDLEFFLELDPEALGLGGSVLRQHSVLTCDTGGRPIHYSSEAGGTRWEVRFEGDVVHATLPDRSTHVIPRAGAEFLAADNIPSHKALLLACLSERKALNQPVTVGLFLANRLATVPYQLDPAPDLSAESGPWYRSSHLEEIRRDESGLLVEGMVRAQGIHGRRLHPPPPFPDWREAPAAAIAPLRYVPPAGASFRLVDVTVPGPVVPIGATLSIPHGRGPFPSVLFVAGSGVHDRHGIAPDMDLGTHEIMDALADRGLLGLRFDSRGAGSTRLGDDTLVRGIDSDLADARACLEFLLARPEAAGRSVFLVGHSQGGTESLALAAEFPRAVHGVALLATMGRRIDEVIVGQIVSTGKAVGLNPEQISAQIQEFQDVVRLVHSGEPWDPEKVPHHLLAMFPNPVWLKQFLAYDPPTMLARLRCPLLVCQGGKDFQVAQLDAERIVAAAKAAGVSCSHLRFPNLDHLFKHTEGESTVAKYYDQSRHIDLEFIDRLGAWLLEHASRPE